MNFKNWDARIWIGGGLVLLGLLMLVDRVGLLHGVTTLFWGALFLAAAAYFLYRFVKNSSGEWWAAIPAFALLGIGATILVSEILPSLSGMMLLTCLGLGFFTIYFTGRDRWWAIIPGGVLVSLGLMIMAGDVFGAHDSAGLMFVGFGLTFVLVAVLAGMQWAWIPGFILFVLGALIGTPFIGTMNLIWPAALILGGLLLILQFVRRR